MPDAKLSAFKCPTCSAPLQIPEHLSDIRCHYCGNAIHVERTKAPSMPAGMPKSTNTVYLDPNAGKAVGWIIALSVGVPILIPVIIGIVSVAGSALHSRVMSLPTKCDANDEITITGKTYEGKGPLITAASNCKVTIKDSHLKSDVVVKAGTNFHLTIENSTLEGSTAALDFSESNAHVDISGKSEIKGKDAIRAPGVNVEIKVTDSKITGVDNGIVAKDNFKLTATNVEITGATSAMTLGTNPELELHDTKLTSPGTALIGKLNLKVDGEGVTISGDAGGVKAPDGNLTLSLAKKSQVTSKKGIGIEVEEANADIALDDSSVDGVDSAIHGGLNCHLVAKNKSHVHSTGTVMETETNPELTLEDSTLEGGDVGLEARLNAHVKVTKGGRIFANKTAIDGHGNLEVDLQGGTIESKGVAIAGSTNTQIHASKKSVIKGGTAALQFDRHPETLELNDTTMTGPQKLGAN